MISFIYQIMTHDRVTEVLDNVVGPCHCNEHLKETSQRFSKCRARCLTSFSRMGNFFNVFKRYFKNRDTRCLMLGLDAAGKTTVLYKLKLGEHVTTIPTIGFNVETIEYKSFNLNIWDVGGQDRIRALWRHYYHNTQGLIFVVDSNEATLLPQHTRFDLRRRLE